MAHINSDTVDLLKSMHQDIHYLLKRYKNEQNVTEEELVKELENVQDCCAGMISEWNDYLGRE